MENNLQAIGIDVGVGETTYAVIAFDKATREIVAILGTELTAEAAKRLFNEWEGKLDLKNYEHDVVQSGTFKTGDLCR